VTHSNPRTPARQVLHVCLNGRYAAVLSAAGARVVLHSLAATTGPGVEEGDEQAGVRRCFDTGPQGDAITCMALTEHFLVLGTELGNVRASIPKCKEICKSNRSACRSSYPPNTITARPLLARQLELGGDDSKPAIVQSFIHR